jgi:hypothetical protein
MNRLLVFIFILIFNSWSKSSFAQQLELDNKEVISKWELRALYFNFNVGPQFSDQYFYVNAGSNTNSKYNLTQRVNYFVNWLCRH